MTLLFRFFLNLIPFLRINITLYRRGDSLVDKKNRSIIYIRRSKEDTNQDYSLKNQEAVCKKYIKDKGWKYVDTIKDEGKTGRNFNRKGIEELLDLADEGRIDYVVVFMLDRFGRNLIEGVHLTIRLFLLGVIIVSAEDQQIWDLNKFADFLMLIIKQNAAQEESKNIGIRTVAGKIARFKEGRWIGKAPYGYYKDKQTKKITVNNNSKQLIETLFNKFVEVGDYSSVINDYSEEFDKIFELELHTARLKTILQNPVYCGEPRFRDILRTDPELSVVQKDVFDKAQKIINSKKRHIKKTKRKSEFLIHMKRNHNLDDQQLLEYIFREEDLKPLCKNCHLPMKPCGYTNVGGFNEPNYKCTLCGYERSFLRRCDMDKYDVAALLSCPICRTLESFRCEKANNHLFKYSCKKCGHSFLCEIHPDKYFRRTQLKRKNAKEVQHFSNTSQQKLDLFGVNQVPHSSQDTFDML